MRHFLITRPTFVILGSFSVASTALPAFSASTTMDRNFRISKRLPFLVHLVCL